MKKLVVLAAAVGILAFFIGFGFDLSDETLSAASDALSAGIEAIVSSLVTLIGGYAVVRQN